jgi:hypothetical protein
MAALQVLNAPANQPTLTGVVNKPAGIPSGPLPVVSKPANVPAKLPVVSKPAGVQPSLSVQPLPQQPNIYVPPKPPEPPKMDKIAADIGVARGRGADDTTILYSLVKKNPALTQPVKIAIQERKATPTQVLDQIIAKYQPKQPEQEEKKGFFGRVGDDLKKRLGNVKAAAGTDDSTTEYGLQVAGQVAGFLGDIAGEGVTSGFRALPDSIENPIREAGREVLAGPVGDVIGKAAQAYEGFKENHPRIARNVEATANIASVAPVGKLIKAPINAATKTVAKTGKTIGGVTKFGVSQATGLSPETVTQIIKNPKAITTAQKAGLDRISLASRVKEGIDLRLTDLGETGKAYETIRKSGGSVEIPTGTIDGVLGKYGLNVKNGKIVTTAESVPLSQGDKTAIEGFIKQYGTQQKLSGNGFLNARKALSNLAEYDAAKTDISNTISRELRSTYDELGKKQLDGLEALDAKFAPEVKLLKQIKRDYLNPDGTLKDGALNKIANLTGKGKDQTLARLEQIVPNIHEDINILKALEDIEYTKGQKVGTYLRGASGGFVLSGGNPAIAIASAIIASPQIAVPILKAYGIITNTSKDIINRIISKIRQGIKPVAEEAQIVSDAIERYAKEFVENPRIGLQIKMIGVNDYASNGSKKFVPAPKMSKKEPAPRLSKMIKVNDSNNPSTTKYVPNRKP